jgi:hypothetical protein
MNKKKKLNRSWRIATDERDRDDAAAAVCPTFSSRDEWNIRTWDREWLYDWWRGKSGHPGSLANHDERNCWMIWWKTDEYMHGNGIINNNKKEDYSGVEKCSSWGWLTLDWIPHHFIFYQRKSYYYYYYYKTGSHSL